MIIPGQLPLTPRAKTLLEQAQREAQGLRHNYLGTEHLLLALAREDDGVAWRILQDLNITIPEERVRALVLRIVGVGEEGA